MRAFDQLAHSLAAAGTPSPALSHLLELVCPPPWLHQEEEHQLGVRLTADHKRGVLAALRALTTSSFHEGSERVARAAPGWVHMISHLRPRVDDETYVYEVISLALRAAAVHRLDAITRAVVTATEELAADRVVLAELSSLGADEVAHASPAPVFTRKRSKLPALCGLLSALSDADSTVSAAFSVEDRRRSAEAVHALLTTVTSGGSGGADGSASVEDGEADAARLPAEAEQVRALCLLAMRSLLPAVDLGLWSHAVTPAAAAAPASASAAAGLTSSFSGESAVHTAASAAESNGVNRASLQAAGVGGSGSGSEAAAVASLRFLSRRLGLAAESILASASAGAAAGMQGKEGGGGTARGGSSAGWRDPLLLASCVEVLVRVAQCQPRSRSMVTSAVLRLVRDGVQALLAAGSSSGISSSSGSGAGGSGGGGGGGGGAAQASLPDFVVLQTSIAAVVDLASRGPPSPFAPASNAAATASATQQQQQQQQQHQQAHVGSSNEPSGLLHTVDLQLVTAAMEIIRNALVAASADVLRSRPARTAGVLRSGAAYSSQLQPLMNLQTLALNRGSPSADGSAGGSGGRDALLVPAEYRSLLLGGLCALMSVELGIPPHQDTVYRMSPAVSEGSAAFDSSASRAAVYALCRELQSARDTSLAAGNRGRRGSLNTGAAPANSAAAAAEDAKERRKAEMCAMALERASELVRCLVHIAVSCDHSGITSVVVQAFLDTYAQEKERVDAAAADSSKRLRLGLPKMQLQLPMGTGGSGSGGAASGGAAAASNAAPASAEKSSGMFSRFFGRTPASASAAKGEERPQVSVPGRSGTVGSGRGGDTAASQEPGDRFAFGRLVVSSLSQLATLRSSSARAGYGVVVETFTTRYAQTAQQAQQAPYILHGLANVLSKLGADLRAVTAFAVRDATIASRHGAASRGTRKRLAAEAAQWEARRSDFRHRLLLLVSQLGGEMVKRRALPSTSTAAAASAASGVDPGPASVLGAALPALAHALVRTELLPIDEAALQQADARYTGNGYGHGGAGKGNAQGGPSRLHHFMSRNGAASQASFASRGDGGGTGGAAPAAPAADGAPAAGFGGAAASMDPDTVSGNYSVPQRSTAASVKSYRTLWLSLVLGRFTDAAARTWPSLWYRATRAIAVNTPVLVVRGAANFVDMDLSATSGSWTGRGGQLDAGSVAEMRSSLFALLPDQRDCIQALAPSHVAFVRSVYALETLRASSGSCKAPFLYLYDAGIEREGLGPVIAGVCDAAFRAFCSRVMRMGRTEQREALLRDHVLYFMAHCAHRFVRVRNASFKYLVELVDRFPQLLWDEQLIHALLDCVEALARRAVQGNNPAAAAVIGRPAPTLASAGVVSGGAAAAAAAASSSGRGQRDAADAFEESSALAIPSLPYVIHTPSAQTELTDILSDFTELACQWLLRAVVSAPEETRSAFQRFIARLALATRNAAVRPAVVLGSTGAAVVRFPTALPPTAVSRPQSVQSGDKHVGVAVGLAALAAPTAQGAAPLVRPYGMTSRVRAAAAALLGRSPQSLTSGLSSLAASGAHVRWSGVGMTAAAAGPGAGQGQAGAAASALPPAAAGSLVSMSPYASGSSSAVTGLGGFFSTPWARSTLRSVLGSSGSGAATAATGAGARGSGTAPARPPAARRGTVTAPSIDEAAEEEDEDEAVSRTGGGDAASVRSFTTDGARSSRVQAGGAASVSGPPQPALTAQAALEHAAAAAALSLSFGSATSMSAAVLGLQAGSDTGAGGSGGGRLGLDPLSLLSSRLAPSFTSVSERRSHYMGQIEGMAAFHASDMSASRRSAAAFQYVLRKSLTRSLSQLLLVAQSHWRDSLARGMLATSKAGGGVTAAGGVTSDLPDAEVAARIRSLLFTSDVLNDVIGVLPAEALPAVVIGAGGAGGSSADTGGAHSRVASSASASAGLRVKRGRGGAVLVYGPESASSSSGESSDSSDVDSVGGMSAAIEAAGPSGASTAGTSGRGSAVAPLPPAAAAPGSRKAAPARSPASGMLRALLRNRTASAEPGSSSSPLSSSSSLAPVPVVDARRSASASAAPAPGGAHNRRAATVPPVNIARANSAASTDAAPVASASPRTESGRKISRSEPALVVPSLLHLAVAGWRHALRSQVALHENMEQEATTVLYRTAAFLVWLHDPVKRGGDSTVRASPFATAAAAASAFEAEGSASEGARARTAAAAAASPTSAAGANERTHNLRDKAVADLLPLLVWLPVRTHTVPSITAAIECWEWVLAAVPALRLRLLAEIVAAWRWSIASRHGLFSGSGTPMTEESPAAAPATGAGGAPATPTAGTSSGKASSTDADTMPDLLTPPEPHLRRNAAQGSGHIGTPASHQPLPPLPPGLCDVEPHRCMLTFFETHFRACRSRSGEELALLCTAASAAVADTTKLSAHPASFGVRIRLLHFAMCILHAAHYPSYLRAHRNPRWENGPIARGAAHLVRLHSAKSEMDLSGGGGDLGSAGGGDGSGSSSGGEGAGATSAGLGGVGAWNSAVPGFDASFGKYAMNDDAHVLAGGSVDDNDNEDEEDRDDGEGEGAGGGAPSLLFHSRSAAAAAPGDDTSSRVSAPWYFEGDHVPGRAAGGYDEFGVYVADESRQATAAGVRKSSTGSVQVLGASAEYWPSLAAGSLALLRERIYRCALSWFELAPSYYEIATSPETVRADWPYLLSFCRLLQADARFQFSSDVNGALAARGGGGDGAGSGVGYGSGGFSSTAATSGTGTGAAATPGRAPLPPSSFASPAPKRVATAATLVATTPGTSRTTGGSDDLRRLVLGRLAHSQVAASGTGAGAGASGGTVPNAAATVLLQSAGGYDSSRGSLGRRSSLADALAQVAGYAPRGDGGISSPGFVPPYLRTVSGRYGYTVSGGARTGTGAGASLRGGPSHRLHGFGLHSGVSWGSAGGAGLGSDGGSATATQLATAISAGLVVSSPLLQTAAAGIAAVRNMRDLLLLLMGHEVDRMVAWHNPLDVEERRLPDVAAVSLDARLLTVTGNPTATAAALGRAEWSRHATTAWAVHPLLALQLWRRFKFVRDLTASMSSLVLSDPPALRGHPDAVALLVTADTVAADAPQLKQLLLWAPTSMPVLLNMLSRCSAEDDLTRIRGAPLFVHPLVAAYLVRCLRRFTPDTIAFYLPQLVQALRHDASGQLADFLFATSQTSMLVAHQLIWLLVSESKATDDSDKHAHKQPAPATPAAAATANDQGGVGSDGSESDGAGLASMGLSLASSAGGAGAGAGAGAAAATKHGFQRQLKGADPLPARAIALTERIVATFPPTAKALFELQYTFWDNVTNISGRLKTEVADASQRRSKIREFLKDLQHASERDYFIAKARIYRAMKQELNNLSSAAEGGERGEDAAAADAATLQPTAAPIGAAAASGAAIQPQGPSKRPVPLAGAVKVLGGKTTGAATLEALAGSPLPAAADAPGTAAAAIQPATVAVAETSVPVPGGAGAGAGAAVDEAGNVTATTATAAAVATAPGAAASTTTAAATGALMTAEELARCAADEVPDLLDVVYMPTNPYCRVVSVDLESGRPMQSAAKCPFMLTFTVAPYDGPDSTLRKEERKEERRRREQARLASHARSAGLSRPLRLRKRESAMVRARLAAQHAASLMRQQMQVQRVQLGLTLERTREQMSKNLHRQREEMAKGVSKGVSSMVRGMQDMRQRLTTGIHGMGGAGGAGGGGGGGSVPALTDAAPGLLPTEVEGEGEGELVEGEEQEEGATSRSGSQAFDGDSALSVSSGLEGEGEDGEDAYGSSAVSHTDEDDSAAYADADGARHASDAEEEEAEEGDTDGESSGEEGEGEGDGHGGGHGGALDGVDHGMNSDASGAAAARQHGTSTGGADATVDATGAGAGAADGAGGGLAGGAEPSAGGKGRRRLRDRLGLSKLGGKLRRKKKGAAGTGGDGADGEELHPSTMTPGGDEAGTGDKRSGKRRLRGFRLHRKKKASPSAGNGEVGVDGAPLQDVDVEGDVDGGAEDGEADGDGDGDGDGRGADYTGVQGGGATGTQRVLSPNASATRAGAGAGQRSNGTAVSASKLGSSPFARMRLGSRPTAGRSGSSKNARAAPGPSRGLPPAAPAAAAQQLTKRSCIFKVFDDCRQDALAIQVIKLFERVFDTARLGLYLYPYRVIPTRTGAKKAPGGILECVPDVRSRDEIGKAGFTTLFDYFVNTFGRPDGAEFEQARRNMVRSLAAYAVVCYILRIKDRHNGNLLVSARGHLIHIDFGFLLGISPGGNLGFETAAFKLTQEMLDIMGGSTDTEMFAYFSELVCRAFLLARDNMEAVHGLVAGMADSGLPCYFFGDTLSKLWGRFRPEDSPLKACRFMRDETLQAANRMTTILYDGIQKLQNNIHSEAWQ